VYLAFRHLRPYAWDFAQNGLFPANPKLCSVPALPAFGAADSSQFLVLTSFYCFFAIPAVTAACQLIVIVIRSDRHTPLSISFSLIDFL